MGVAHNGRGVAVAVVMVGLVQTIAFPSIARAGFFDFLFGAFQSRAVRPYEAYPGQWGRRHADREAAMRAIEKELESRMAQVQHDWMIYQALRKPLLRRFGRGLRHVELLLVLDA